MSFLGKEDQVLDVKFIFDHLRNIGICVAIAVSAQSLFLNSKNQKLIEVVVCPIGMGYVLAIASGLLLTLNFVQLIYLMAGKLNKRYKISWLSALALVAFIAPIYVVTLGVFFGQFYA